MAEEAKDNRIKFRSNTSVTLKPEICAEKVDIDTIFSSFEPGQTKVSSPSGKGKRNMSTCMSSTFNQGKIASTIHQSGRMKVEDISKMAHQRHKL